MKSPTDEDTLRQLALGDLEHELARTRRMLERVPDEHLGWKPHDRSWTLGHLASHLANLVYWQVMILRQDEFDLGVPLPPREAPRSGAALLEEFDAHTATLRAALEEMDDQALVAQWTLRRGEHVLLRQPRVAVIREMGISHMAHHRGQLSVFLRLLNVPVPGLYGPSADEQLGG